MTNSKTPATQHVFLTIFENNVKTSNDVKNRSHADLVSVK